MRLALLSDIHGNLAGLRAVAAALADAGPFEAVIVAGDHLWGGPRPVEVWSWLRASGWLLVRGNEDESLALPSVAGTAGDAGPYRQAYRAMHAWGRARLGTTIPGDLAALPLQRRLPTPAGDLLVVHASPRTTRGHAGAPQSTLAELTDLYSGTGASAIAFGHYHRSFVRPTPFALLINVASVGLPIDGRPLAAYTILTAAADGWTVEQRLAPYDPAEEEAAAHAAGLPPWQPDPS